jgi:hypothetical protein
MMILALLRINALPYAMYRAGWLGGLVGMLVCANTAALLSSHLVSRVVLHLIMLSCFDVYLIKGGGVIKCMDNATNVTVR